MTTAALSEMLAPYGAATDTVLPLDGPLDARARLDYADLLHHAGDPPDGVVRIEQATVAYVLRGITRPIEPGRILAMRRMLAQRDDAPFLVVVEPGRLAIYGVDLDRLGADAALLRAIEQTHEAAPATFRRLHQEQPARAQAVHTLVHDLLTVAISGLHEVHGILQADAIALAGRALFMRFLVDRGVLDPFAASAVCPGAEDWTTVFASATRVRATCSWIDETFNGDFLPVALLRPTDGSAGTPDAACDLLGAIMRRRVRSATEWEQLDLGLPTSLGWDDLDFAHIPVGVLSQVYEHQAQRWSPDRRRGDSVFYTPRRIAEYMVREAFGRLEAVPGSSPHTARVLDPAVGGGVFLVAAFRELAAAWQRHTGQWPSSLRLRRILFEQLTGFDIQDSALSLTSLSLYLTAVELDRPPFLFAELRFERPLRGNVLFDVADPRGPATGAQPGSLGPAVGPEHDARYDVVIANPPWTTLQGRPGAEVIAVATERVRPVVAARLGDARAGAFRFPDKAPDLPFVWRAMQWARPGGVLAFALHARLLFKTSAIGQRARQDMLDAATVWGVLNGADLRMTEVWPGVQQPFCLVFADNALPAPEHAFYMVSPYFEPGLNGSGRLRIDPDAIHPVSPGVLTHQPALLKILFRGTALDAHVLDRLLASGRLTVKAWWAELGLRRQCGQGYIVGNRRFDAAALSGRPSLTARAQVGPLLDTDRLPPFGRPRLERPRHPELYAGPLVLLREAVRTDRQWASVSDEGVVFNESFYGYGAHGHPNAHLMVRYLFLLFRSDVFHWFNLVTGGKFGVERESWKKTDVDAFPVVPFRDLEPSLSTRVPELFDACVAGQLDPSSLDDWVARVYGLGRRSMEVIADTLAVGSPHAEARSYASGTPEPEMIEAFATRLGERLAPFADLPVRVLPGAPGDPYCALLLGAPEGDAEQVATSARAILELADRRGSSECVVASTDGCIWLARLAQRRYWTLSRARLTASRLVDEHLSGPARGPCGPRGVQASESQPRSSALPRAGWHGVFHPRRLRLHHARRADGGLCRPGLFLRDQDPARADPGHRAGR